MRPSSQAKVALRDGRMLRVETTVTPSRPQLELVSKGVQHEEPVGEGASPVAVQLGSTTNSSATGPNDLPLQRRLVFFLRSRVPAVFPRTEKIEIAAVDGSFGATLSLADRGPDGGMMSEPSRAPVWPMNSEVMITLRFRDLAGR